MRRLLAAFQQAPEEEKLLEGNFDKEANLKLQAMAKEIGLHCEAYGKGSERNTVISKRPLARYRAEYDNAQQLGAQVVLSDCLHAAVSQALRDFKVRGLPSLKKRGRKLEGPADDECSLSAHTRPRELGADAIKREGGADAAAEGCQHMRNEAAASTSTRSSTAAPQAMLDARARLPAFQCRAALLEALRASQVVVVSGETGCGKTTQLPQFILEEWAAAGGGAPMSIICTQPRRISAVSIAQRVAQERGERVGDTVGYKIRLESCASERSRLLFVTTGVLLRRLVGDPELKGVSHVIVDEIHERGVNEDLLLVILRDLLPRRRDLTLVLMSATLNAASFEAFFPASAPVHIPGFTHPVEVSYLEGLLERSGLPFRPDSSPQSRTGGGNRRGAQHESLRRATPFDNLDARAVAGRMRSRGAAAAFEAWCDAVSAASSTATGTGMLQVSFVADVIQWLHAAEGPGAMLVFCTGFEDIKNINSELQRASQEGRLSGAHVVPLHGSMPTIHQRSIFEPAAAGTRKILLATNIAETSITIDDVTLVVDCGLHKVMTYDQVNKIRQLSPAWVAKANAKQRSGRAGRVRAGKCFRLYPEALHDALPPFLLPEMQRISLEDVCLQLKSIGLGRVGPFLARAMDPPEHAAVENAVKRLRTIGAFDADEELTALGRHLAQLPVDPSIGKLILMGVLFDCLDPILTMAASLSYRDPFVTPLEQRPAADASKKQLAGPELSDHFALLAAFEEFRRLRAQRPWGEVRRWCGERFLVADTLSLIADMREQLAQVLCDAGFVSLGGAPSPAGGRGGLALEAAVRRHSAHGHERALLKAILVAGLYPNVAAVVRSRNPQRPPQIKTHDSGRVAIHPSSVVASCGGGAFGHAWLVYTNKLLTREVYLSTVTEVSELAVLLFSGDLERDAARPDVLTLHRRFFEFAMDPRSAELLLELRRDVDRLLEAKLAAPDVDVATVGAPLLHAILLLLDESEQSRAAHAPPPGVRQSFGHARGSRQHYGRR